MPDPALLTVGWIHVNELKKLLTLSIDPNQKRHMHESQKNKEIISTWHIHHMVMHVIIYSRPSSLQRYIEMGT